MTPLLSICIMTYKRMRTLRELLDSVLPQVENLPDVEVMVSDDASPDDTEKMMREYCARHPCVRYVRIPKNLGLDGNVITVVENAAGEYITFFSDDDIAPPGYFNRILEELKEVRPVVAYFNHTPFYDNDPALLGAPTQPLLKRVFTDPTEYFLYTGLGFMSGLTVKTVEARKHVSKVNRSLSSAHVDITSRAALTTSGPFLFDGTINVLARYELESSYDVLTHGPMNVTRVHMALRDEGLLTQAAVDWFCLKVIRSSLARCLVNNRLNSKKPVPASALWKLYGRYPQFYRFIYPLALIPPPLVRWIALPLRAIMRKRRLSMAKGGKPPKHIFYLPPPSGQLRAF
jgi:glycosyltransferase involved in cell wall biosynthesis